MPTHRGLGITALLIQCYLAQTQSTEAWVLKQTMLQSQAETRIALLDQFRADFQQAKLIPWAFDQICEAMEATGQHDLALQAGERLLSLDPQDIEIAHKGLKLAEKKKDAALTRKWAQLADRAADSVLASLQASATRVDLARSVRGYTDYLAYSEILQIADPAAKRERLQDFLRSHNHSAYRSAAQDLYLETWRQSGDARKTLEAARSILEQDDTNLTALTLVAESYLAAESEPKKLVTYATRILALLDGPPGAEGSKRKAQLAGRAHWMIGMASMQQEKFGDADRSIRAALPSLRSDSRLVSAALFYLGWANYRLGRVADAIRFNKECVLVKGPYREHAERNLRVIHSETAARN